MGCWGRRGVLMEGVVGPEYGGGEFERSFSEGEGFDGPASEFEGRWIWWLGSATLLRGMLGPDIAG